MAVIDLTGSLAPAQPRARKPLHPSLYLLIGIAAITLVAVLMDTLVDLIF